MEFIVSEAMREYWFASLVQRPNYTVSEFEPKAFVAESLDKVLKMIAGELGMRPNKDGSAIPHEEIWQFAFDNGWYFAYFSPSTSHSPVRVVI